MHQDSRFEYNEYSYCSLWDVLTFFTGESSLYFQGMKTMQNRENMSISFHHDAMLT